MKTIALVSCFFMIFFSASAQFDIIKGTLTDDETSEPIPFANIVIEKNNKMYSGTTADIHGNYELMVPDTMYQFTIKVSFVGYKTKLITVNRKKDAIPPKNKAIRVKD